MNKYTAMGFYILVDHSKHPEESERYINYQKVTEEIVINIHVYGDKIKYMSIYNSATEQEIEIDR